MSGGGTSGVNIFGARHLMWRGLTSAAQGAATRCSRPCALPEPYDTHAAGGAP